MKINSVIAADSTFPKRLREIPDAPTKLWFTGSLPDENRLHVAIVGTRKPTAYGTEITRRLAEGLAARGAIIVSGLALGVDAIAHQGALSAKGGTIAVLAGGVEKPSPFSNRHIADKINNGGGAIVSEFDPGTPPLQHQFLQRNRVVAGLSDILILTEASDRSGTMNTVSHALVQGKDVYVAPGHITSPMSKGCNRVIAQGATPIVDIDEFIDQILPQSREALPLFGASQEETTILELLTAGVRDGEELHEKSGLEPHIFAETMTMMEIQGIIRPLGANRWTR